MDIPRHRNPKWVSENMIDVELRHAEFGWIPFSVSREENEEFFNVLETTLGEFKALPIEEQRKLWFTSSKQIRDRLISDGKMSKAMLVITSSGNDVLRDKLNYSDMLSRSDEDVSKLLNSLGYSDTAIDKMFQQE